MKKKISVQWKGNLVKDAFCVEIIWNHNSNPYWGQNVADRRITTMQITRVMFIKSCTNMERYVQEVTQKPCYFKNWKSFIDLVLIITNSPFKLWIRRLWQLDFKILASLCTKDKAYLFLLWKRAKLGKETHLNLDEASVYYWRNLS